MKTVIKVELNGSERLPYELEDHSVLVGQEQMSNYHNFCCELHWHNDLELISVTSGVLMLSINGVFCQVPTGEGIIINSGRFHTLYTKIGEDCEFLCVILSPNLLCGSPRLEHSFVRPFIASSAPDFFSLCPEVPWQSEIQPCISLILACQNQISAPLLIQEQFFRIWEILFQNAFQDNRMLYEEQRDQKQAVVQKMARFIKQNYRERLTLTDIANAGFVSKNSCNSLFRKYMGDTHINYLINFRLSIGAELLRSSQLSVTAISEASGFSNPSYFTECFHRVYGCTPGEYREKSLL